MASRRPTRLKCPSLPLLLHGEFSTARNRLDGRLKATAVRGIVEPEGDLDDIFEELFGSSASGSCSRDYTDFAA